MSNTYQWFPTECAPLGYPMSIVKGNFIFADRRSVYIADDRLIYNGWGAQGSLHVVGDKLKPLPTQLELSWFSYTEDQFYGGKFDLPLDKLSEMFRSGTASPDGSERWAYDRIIVGMAPGGDISVWVGARRIVKELVTFRAKAVNLPWTVVLDHPTITRTQHIADQLNEAMSPEMLKRVKSKPVPLGRWAQFSKRVAWSPRIGASANGRDLWIMGLNGEVEWMDLSGYRKDVDPPLATRASPKGFSLYWRTGAGVTLNAEIVLDEDEVLAAFTKLSALATNEPMTVLLEPASTSSTVDVFLQRGKIIYRFEKSKTNIFRAK